MAMSARALLIVLLGCGAAGCAAPHLFTNYPPRAADLYPLSQTTNGITVAVDGVADEERASRLFGADLPSLQVLPVALIVTNSGTHRVILRPGDVLAHQGTQVVDPLPPSAVASLTSGGLADYYDRVAFKETMVAPGESYHGVLFFAVPPSVQVGGEYSSLPVFAGGGLQLIIAAHDMETRARLHFGPFSVGALQSQ
jgi:hypothetical protein